MEREGFYAEASASLIEHQQWDLEQGDQVTSHAPLPRLRSYRAQLPHSFTPTQCECNLSSAA